MMTDAFMRLRKALKTRRLQKQTSSMHAIPSRRSNGVVLETLKRLGKSATVATLPGLFLWLAERFPLFAQKIEGRRDGRANDVGCSSPSQEQPSSSSR